MIQFHKVPKRLWPSLKKSAYMDIINDAMYRRSVSSFDITGYERDSDRVHFRSEGRDCYLYGVEANPDYASDWLLPVRVLATNNGVYDIWEVNLSLSKFRVDTLRKIAYEVYDACKDADWEDFEDAENEAIRNRVLDYMQFMS